MKTVTWFAVSFIMIASSAARAGWPDESQMGKVPAGANAIMAMDVSGAYASPLGVKDGWSKRYAESHHASLGSLPPNVESMLVAAQFDYGRLEPFWQLGLAKTTATLDDVAKSEYGVVTQVAGQTAVESPRGVYFASAGNWQLGVYAPADRQAFARWLRGPAATGKSGVSEYLKKAVASKGNAHAIIAADLSDVVDPVVSRMYLAHLPTAAQHKLDPVSLSSLFTGIKGAILRITVTDKLNAQLQLDFSDPIGPLAQFLPNLLHDLLADAGAALYDVKAWKPTFTQTSMILEGPLSMDSLHKIMSLFELPGGPGPVSPGAAASQEGKADVTATLRYFKSVSDILDELRKRKSDLQDEKAYDKYALWYENYAKKIDYLPTIGVDAELVDFGLKTAGALRGIAASLRGVPLKTKEAGAGAYFYYTGYAQRWGRRSAASGITSINTNVDQVRQQQEKIIGDDAQARTDVWNAIDDHMATIRSKLGERYKLVF